MATKRKKKGCKEPHQKAIPDDMAAELKREEFRETLISWRLQQMRMRWPALERKLANERFVKPEDEALAG